MRSRPRSSRDLTRCADAAAPTAHKHHHGHLRASSSPSEGRLTRIAAEPHHHNVTVHHNGTVHHHAGKHEHGKHNATHHRPSTPRALPALTPADEHEHKTHQMLLERAVPEHKHEHHKEKKEHHKEHKKGGKKVVKVGRD